MRLTLALRVPIAQPIATLHSSRSIHPDPTWSWSPHAGQYSDYFRVRTICGLFFTWQPRSEKLSTNHQWMLTCSLLVNLYCHSRCLQSRLLHTNIAKDDAQDRNSLPEGTSDGSDRACWAARHLSETPEYATHYWVTDRMRREAVVKESYTIS